MVVGARAIIELKLKSRPEVILKALEPETKTSVSPRSRVKLELKNRRLLIDFMASDVSALRASISAYTRWLSMLTEVIQTLEEWRAK